MQFNVGIDSEKINRQLILSLKNTANPSLGPSGIYKTYIRIMVPSDSQVVSVKSVSGQTQKTLTPEIIQENGRQEIGVYIEITPQASTDVVFEWQSSLGQSGGLTNYGLYIRKQAGVNDDPISIKFSAPGPISSVPNFTLTGGGLYTYNTTLDQDFFARFSWKK